MQHPGDDHTLDRLHAKGLRQFRRQVVGFDADPAPCDLTVFDQALHHHARRRHRNREADAHAAPRARVDCGVDAKQVPVNVDQRTAGIARVDGGVGLDEVLEGVDAELVAPQRADDPTGDGLPHAKRVPYGQHLVAHLQRFRVADDDDRQPVHLDFQNRQVGVGVGPDHPGHRVPAVVERHFDLVGAFNDMVVGQHIACRTDDNATAESRLRLAAWVAVKEPEPGVAVGGALSRGFAGIDADDCRRRLLHRAPEAFARSPGRVTRRRLDHRNDPGRVAPTEPVGLEGGDNKIRRQQHRGGL